MEGGKDERGIDQLEQVLVNDNERQSDIEEGRRTEKEKQEEEEM